MQARKKHVSELNRERSEGLRQKVLKFFREYPFASQEECALALGISPITVCRHVGILRERMREDMRV